MKKIQTVLILSITFIAIVLALYVLSIKRPMDPEKMAKAAGSYFDILELLKKAHPDFKSAEKIYLSQLSPLFKKVDKSERRRLDGNVRDALAQGPKGNIPNVAIEIIDIKIQQGFFSLLLQEIESMKQSGADINPSVLRLKACLKVIEPAIFSWSGLQKNKDLLKAAYSSDLDKLIALAGKNPNDFENQADKFIKIIKSGYLIGVLHSVSQIEKLQGDNPSKALENIARGKLFYNLIMEDHAKIDLKSSILLEGEFRNKPGKVNTDFIRNKLKEAFADYTQVTTKNIFMSHKTPLEIELKTDEALPGQVETSK